MTDFANHPVFTSLPKSAEVLAGLERDGLIKVLPLEPAPQVDKVWDPTDQFAASFSSLGWAGTWMACAGTTYDEPLHRDPSEGGYDGP